MCMNLPDPRQIICILGRYRECRVGEFNTIVIAVIHVGSIWTARFLFLARCGFTTQNLAFAVMFMFAYNFSPRLPILRTMIGGGVQEIEKKAKLLYDYIDQSNDLPSAYVSKSANVPFRINPPE